MNRKLFLSPNRHLASFRRITSKSNKSIPHTIRLEEYNNTKRSASSQNSFFISPALQFVTHEARKESMIMSQSSYIMKYFPTHHRIQSYFPQSAKRNPSFRLSKNGALISCSSLSQAAKQRPHSHKRYTVSWVLCYCMTHFRRKSEFTVWSSQLLSSMHFVTLRDDPVSPIDPSSPRAFRF